MFDLYYFLLILNSISHVTALAIFVPMFGHGIYVFIQVIRFIFNLETPNEKKNL